MPGPSFFAELRKRKVVQAAAIYGAVAWGVTEIVVTVVEQLFLPQWVSTLTVILFVVGFPVAMFLAWTFDITREGITRTTVTSRRGTTSIVLSLVLLVTGTAGLFLLIRPSLQDAEPSARALVVVPNSIAVLPFENAGPDARDDWLSEGLSDELRDQLARVAGIRIAARSSSKAAAERRLDAFEASARLGVASIVEGSVRRQGGLVRVSVQLIEGSSGLALWSETFERGPRELLLVQQAIAQAVVHHVLPGSGVAAAEPATRDPTANELMLLARHYEQQVRERQDVDPDLLLEATRLYREATGADPKSALAHARLAGALVYLGDVDAAEPAIFRALSLDPNLSEVQNTLGLYYFARGLPEAGAAWARAVELDANNPEALSSYATWRWYRIQPEGVKDMFQRALEVDPMNLERYGTYGSFLALENYIGEARTLVAQVAELFEGAPAARVIAELLDYLGETDRSIAWTIRARDLEPNNPSHEQKLAEYYADIGDAETALKLDPGGIGILFKLRRYEAMIEAAEYAMIERPEDLRLRSLLAVAYNATGRYESAIHVLIATGLPDSVFNGWRSAEEIDGYYALQNALYAIGETDRARELAQWLVDYGYTESNDWWITVRMACDHAVLGQDDLARQALERAQKSLRLVWDPLLKDAPCFEQFARDPVYRATVRYFDQRRAQLRARLPATLAEFGVAL